MNFRYPRLDSRKDIALVVAETVMLVTELCFECFLAAEYLARGDTWWGALTLAFIFLPGVLLALNMMLEDLQYRVVRVKCVRTYRVELI